MEPGPDVTVLCHAPGGGGAQRVARTLTKEFARSGLRVRVILAGGRDTSETFEGAVETVRTRFRRFPFLALELVRYIGDSSPILTSETASGASAVFASGLRGMRTRCVIRVVNPPGRGPSPSVWRHWYWRLVWFVIRKGDRSRVSLVCNSHGTLKALDRSGRSRGQGTTVIHNPVAFPDNPSHQGSADKNFETDGPLLLAAGRLHRQKGFDVLLHAFARLRETRVVTLAIAGEGPLRSDLENLAQQLGVDSHVKFIGYRSDLDQWLRRADLFVLSSRWEGFGLVVAESLGAGTPVVATTCAGGPSEILNDGEFGILTDPEDPEALFVAIERGLDHAWDSRTLIARAEEFSPVRIAGEYRRQLGV